MGEAVEGQEGRLARYQGGLMRKILPALLAFAGCASDPTPTYYEGQSWAQKSYEQASAECYTEIQQRNGPPNYYLCMQAKGWFEVRACRQGLRCATER